MHFKIFSIEEANKVLPDLTRLVRQVNRRRQDLIYLLVELEGLNAQQGQSRQDDELMRRLQTKRAEVEALRRELASLHDDVCETGVVVRDYPRGLLDFPTIIGGEPGYLCWLVGEDSIGYYHGADEGFSGRRPLKAAST